MRTLLIAFILFILMLTPSTAFAQGMMGTQSSISSDGHTAREEQEGKEIWEKLQAKEVTCDKLSDNDFGALGEYFMGQMVGSSHEAMNTMMENMMGKQGEEQMHIILGKRSSGCDTNAKLPSGYNFMPMMWMMGGGGNPMMGWGGGFGIFGWVTMIAIFLLLILGVIALIRYLSGWGWGKRSEEGKSPLDILKERYARGEIDKKEFEERKKDLR
ncbi:SHOCT domain-containing protein [Candidatus Daviesbacteria bacterium]|nr:SHOCT domain-containing protein [Candidatus Daviesbacteria bacterium]